MRIRIGLLGGQTVALGLMMAFLVVPASALFLAEYGAQALPYAYLAVAAAGVALSAAMGRAQRHITLADLAQRVLWAYAALVAAAWAVLVTSDGLWVTFPLLVLFPLSIPIGFVLVGSQAGRLLDVREMKAYFPRVVAGFSVGFAIGGLLAAGLVGPMGGPRHLLAIDTVAALVMVGLAAETARRYPRQLRTPPAPASASAADEAPRQSLRAVFSNRMVTLVFGYQALSAAVTQLLDYIVWERAAARYPDPSDLARFQGVYGAIINVASIAFVAALAGFLLTRYGLGLGLAANPLGVIVLLAVTSVVGYFVGPIATSFFLLVCAQQVVDIALTDGTTRTSINATYQALSPADRLRAQTSVEGYGVPLALGVVGLLLIASHALGLDVRTVCLVTLLMSVAWLALAILAYRAYGVNLRSALSQRAWDPVALRIDDAASQRVVNQLLASPDLRDVQVGLDALADSGSPSAARHIGVLLLDPDPRRRLLGVEVSPRFHTPLPASLLADSDPRVQLAAAGSLVGVTGPEGDRARDVWLTAYQDSRAGEALAAAASAPDSFFVPHLVAMAETDTPPTELIDALSAHADDLLETASRVLADPKADPRVRDRLTQALGRSASPAARDLLVAHLTDWSTAVAEAALRSLAAVGHREAPDHPKVRDALAIQAHRAARALVVLELLGHEESPSPLAEALRDEVAAVGRRAHARESLPRRAGHRPGRHRPQGGPLQPRARP